MQSHHEYTLTGQIREAENQIIMLCNEFPISGIGETSEEAFTDLLNAFLAYTGGDKESEHPTTEYSLSSPSLGVADPISHFSYSMNRRGSGHVVAP